MRIRDTTNPAIQHALDHLRRRYEWMLNQADHEFGELIVTAMTNVYGQSQGPWLVVDGHHVRTHGIAGPSLVAATWMLLSFVHGGKESKD